MTSARPDTWMPLYIGDYLADTMHLTCPQHGAYILLIMAYWRRGGPLPDDDSELSMICRVKLAEWRRLRPTIVRFFQVGDGLWHHKRIDAELAGAQRNVAERKARTAAATAARAQRNDQRNVHRDDNVTTNVTLPPSPSPSPKASPIGEATPPYSPPLAEQPSDDGVIDLTPPEDLDRRPSHAGRERKTDIAAWEPDEQDREYAETHGLDASRVLEDIRGWAANAPPAKRQKRDPRAFWQGWCRRDADRLGGARRANGASARPEPPSFIAAVRDVLDGGEMEPGAEP